MTIPDTRTYTLGALAPSIPANTADFNGDGIADVGQPNVVSLSDPVTNAPAAADMMNFHLLCGSAGFTATVTQYYYGVADKPYVMRKYNPNTGAYTTISSASFSRVTTGGQAVEKASYQITDGGPLDQDGTANGVIVDPSGIALASVWVPNTGFGNGR